MSGALIRIKQYLDLKGISVRAFELKCGFSNGSFASQLKNGKTIGIDRLENILNAFPDINIEWLLTGKGSMAKTDTVPLPQKRPNNRCDRKTLGQERGHSVDPNRCYGRGAFGEQPNDHGI